MLCDYGPYCSHGGSDSHVRNVEDICDLGRGRCFMKDATAFVQSTAVPDYLKKKGLPNEIIQMILPMVDNMFLPERCEETRVGDWTNLYNDLDKIYKPWPSPPATFSGEHGVCTKDRCAFHGTFCLLNPDGQYDPATTTCPLKSYSVWSVHRLEFYLVHDRNKICARPECPWHHESHDSRVESDWLDPPELAAIGLDELSECIDMVEQPIWSCRCYNLPLFANMLQYDANRREAAETEVETTGALDLVSSNGVG